MGRRREEERRGTVAVVRGTRYKEVPSRRLSLVEDRERIIRPTCGPKLDARECPMGMKAKLSRKELDDLFSEVLEKEGKGKEIGDNSTRCSFYIGTFPIFVTCIAVIYFVLIFNFNFITFRQTIGKLYRGDFVRAFEKQK